MRAVPVRCGQRNPAGRHQLWGEVICLDPLARLRPGLVTNPGMFVPGQPGTGRSTLVKRLITGAVAAGVTVLVLGDAKPDYARLAWHLGGQVIRIGRGLDRVNPLGTGPLGQALARMRVPMAMRSGPKSAAGGRPDVLAVLEQCPDPLRSAARASSHRDYQNRTSDLVFTLGLLCTGSLAGVSGGPATQPIDPSAPLACADISRAGAAGDKLLTAAMLCTWAYVFGLAGAAAALADLGLARRGRSWR